jgi:hypothetical protein
VNSFKVRAESRETAQGEERLKLDLDFDFQYEFRP